MKIVECFDNMENDPEVPFEVKLDRFADICPICKQAQEPEFIVSYRVQGSLEVIFKCYNFRCGKLFISNYYNSGYYYNFYQSIPSQFEKAEVGSEIKEVSEKYEDIYNQAFQCEHYGLVEVAGMGYRKALEFLIKDYLISVYPEKLEEIKKAMLGSCIQKYLTNDRIKQIAERAAWLGNDETHYERRWNNKDIEDLKNLIRITEHFISMEIQADKYIIDMPK